MANLWLLFRAEVNLHWCRNKLSVLYAMLLMDISTSTTVKRNLNSNARSVTTCFRLNRDSVKTINQNTSAPTAIMLSSAGKTGKRSRSISVVTITVSIVHRRSLNSIRWNECCRRNEALSSSSATSIGSIIINLRNLYIPPPKNRSSILPKSITPKMSSALFWPSMFPSPYQQEKPQLF